MAKTKTTSKGKPQGGKKSGTASKPKGAKTATKGLTAADGELLAALGADYAVQPDFPVANIAHEARELGVSLSKLGAKLAKSSDLPKDAGKDLAARLGRLERAEAAWNAVRQIRTPKEITALRKRAEKAKRDAFEALRYFAKANGDVQARLDAISIGSGDADLIDDLKKLTELVNEESALLGKAQLPKDAAGVLNGLATELGDAIADRDVSPDAAEAIGARNRAFWHLRELMDEARDAGRYVFREDPANLALFRASVTRARERSRKGKRKTEG